MKYLRSATLTILVASMATHVYALGRYWSAQDIPTLSVPDSTTGITYYVDGINGSDARDGKSLANAFKTLSKATSVVRSGDTVRIRAGLYRDHIDMSSGVSGTASNPITFGPYGNGEVIVDGSARLTWTLDTGRVWKATVSSGWAPGAVVVNETPLKEVSHGQTSGVPAVNRAGVTDNSGKWFYNTSTRTLYADMGSTISSGDPNNADVIVPNNSGGDYHVYYYGSYIRFYGLTVRGAGGAGIWGYGNNVTVERCNIKFNYKHGISFEGDGNSDNASLYNHIYFNCLNNWPRGNNDFVGGGWNQGISGNFSLRMIARGNVVHRNGGEGIGSYGITVAGRSGSPLVDGNVIYDNWSVNVYLDNQPNGVIRNNLIYNHDINLGDLLYTGSTYWTQDIARALSPVGVMLADEEWSSIPTLNHAANLAGTKVYNNLIANTRVGIRDYAEGPNSAAWHGLIDSVIANNTVVLPTVAAPDYNAGIEIADNKTPSGTNRNSNSAVKNNIIYGTLARPLIYSRQGQGLAGVSIDNNAYFNPNFTAVFQLNGTLTNFAGWKAVYVTADRNAVFQDPMLAAVGQLSGGGTYADVCFNIGSGSPAIRLAADLTTLFSSDFFLNPRPAGAWNAGAIQSLSGVAPAAPTNVRIIRVP